jgi:hypothetical protein
LVFGDPIQRYTEIAGKVARALVLTEWKLVKKASDIVVKAQEGRAQAAIYSAGVLGDLELKRTRYVVLVSESEMSAPSDIVEGGVTYRHVVIATEPKRPSVTARSRKART